MTNHTRRVFPVIAFLAATALFSPLALRAQTNATPSSTSTHAERWLHVRVVSTNSKDETVRVNVPLSLAETVLPAINHDRLHDGKVRLGCMDCDGVDIRTLFNAVRNTKDGEFVMVQSKDADISVAKKDGQFLVHVHDKDKPKASQVEVKVPMKVVEALLSAGKDELDVVAGLHALENQGDMELVSVKDEDSTIRVWMDSKSVSD
ncbi:MAG: hypothetical protein WA857_14735 [Candidatus Acidiferrum sp.]